MTLILDVQMSQYKCINVLSVQHTEENLEMLEYTRLSFLSQKKHEINFLV